jgi:hypothetical protein
MKGKQVTQKKSDRAWRICLEPFRRRSTCVASPWGFFTYREDGQAFGESPNPRSENRVLPLRAPVFLIGFLTFFELELSTYLLILVIAII